MGDYNVNTLNEFKKRYYTHTCVYKHMFDLLLSQINQPSH